MPDRAGCVWRIVHKIIIKLNFYPPELSGRVRFQLAAGRRKVHSPHRQPSSSRRRCEPHSGQHQESSCQRCPAATQVTRGAAAAAANAVRLAVNVVCGLIAVYWLDLGMTGFFASVALGFAVYAALLVWAVARVREPAAAAAA